jgi:DNA-binding Lrp family transcriptional regulator
MEKTGIIEANVAVINPALVGQPITLFVEVEVISETAELIDATKREFASAAEVLPRHRRGRLRSRDHGPHNGSLRGAHTSPFLQQQQREAVPYLCCHGLGKGRVVSAVARMTGRTPRS